MVVEARPEEGVVVDRVVAREASAATVVMEAVRLEKEGKSRVCG